MTDCMNVSEKDCDIIRLRNKGYNIVRSEELYHQQEASRSVQAFIDNISFPSSLDELRNVIDERGGFDVEWILCDEEVCWTAPKWAKAGDVVFFMHGKYAIQKITALRTSLVKSKNQYSEEEYLEMMDWIETGERLHKLYGGKIFAIARVTGIPQYFPAEEVQHWKSNIYADMDSVIVLENPIDSSEFNEYIRITRCGAITGVFGDDYQKLVGTIGEKNKLPRYVTESVSIPVPLRKINKDNWIEIAGAYRRSFFLEIQFRSFYVNYLLALLGDTKTIYRECRCCKDTNPDSFVDNIIRLKGKYLPIEVKLNIKVEPYLVGQVTKYCELSKCYLTNRAPDYIDSSAMYSNNVVIIDTNKIFLYDDEKKSIEEIYDLDHLKTREDIIYIRQLLVNSLS